MKNILPHLIGTILNVLCFVLPGFTRKTAIKLLSRIKVVPLKAEELAFFNKGETIWLEVNEIRTALHKWGHGPRNVLFLHGWMSHSYRWESLIDQLDTDSFTAYALDAPAHGQSEGNSLNLEVYRLAYEKALEKTGPIDVLICHSFGNLVAGYQFLFRPEVPIDNYIVMGSPSGMDAIFGYFVDILGLSPRMLQNLRVDVDKILKVPYEDLNMATFFRRCPMPKLIIHDHGDDITPIEPIKKATAGIDSVETYYTHGLDHTLKSTEINDRIVAFMNNHSKKYSSHVLEKV